MSVVVVTSSISETNVSSQCTTSSHVRGRREPGDYGPGRRNFNPPDPQNDPESVSCENQHGYTRGGFPHAVTGVNLTQNTEVEDSTQWLTAIRGPRDCVDSGAIAEANSNVPYNRNEPTNDGHMNYEIEMPRNPNPTVLPLEAARPASVRITVFTVVQNCCKSRSNKYRKWHFWGRCPHETP